MVVDRSPHSLVRRLRAFRRQNNPVPMISPGKLLLYLYHQPVGRIRQSLANGGPIAERETERQRREMEAAAEHMPALPDFPGTTPVTLHLMTGRRFWYQSVFCLHSFALASRTTVRAELYDDGSLDDIRSAHLARLGSGVQIHTYAALMERLDRLLPIAQFPTLRERWKNYPNIRKIVDIHLGKSGWKLVVDSDILFFRRADFILSWLSAPDRPLHAVDSHESYGYSRPLMESLAGEPIPALVNVGLCGLRSDKIDWEELERWCTELIKRERTSYFLEQAVVAMIAARHQPCAVAPGEDYITQPTRDEVVSPRAVMHHYVAESKRWYFRYGWRHVYK
jgi:hypothetical protein